MEENLAVILPKVDRDRTREVLRLALRIRQCDERVMGRLTSGQMAIIYYATTGQELIAAAVGSVLTRDDYVVTTYRGMHDQVGKGVPFDKLFAEYLGKREGTCRGKGGPMHITYPEVGVMVTSGIVGGGIPIATGLGWAATVRGDNRVTVVNFGDGAANIGAFHESMNLAALWQLPVIFLCQNNRYAEHTSYARSQRNETVSSRAAGYGMTGVTVNGNDLSELLPALDEATQRARLGAGPTLIEANTFRFNGHYFGDAQSYIPAGELAAARAADPVLRLRQDVLDAGIVGPDELDAWRHEVDEELDSAWAYAEGASDVTADDLYTDVLQEGMQK